MSNKPKGTRSAKRFNFKSAMERFGFSPEQKEMLLENDIVITKHGALKRPKAIPSGAQMPEIFKLQRPLTTTDPEPKILVYNQSRTWEALIPLSQGWLNVFGDKMKIYVIALPDAVQGQLKISHVISDQDW